MIFVNWSPDNAPIKGRVLYATAKESFKKYLDLNTKDITVCSKGDVTFVLLRWLNKNSSRKSPIDSHQ
jgi:hypothetical protein